ncbi:subtilase family AB5 toxin binding subunit [Escherichia coli]|nr:subtilase cytotoxin subunit B [Escherichia coli]
MKKLFLLAISFIFYITSAKAEWTGDNAEGMLSGVIINQVHTGQFNASPYFCLEGVQGDNNNIKACLLKNDSKWHPSFELFYLQTMYYYTTKEPVRLYYEPNVWSDSGFKTSLTSNALVGYSTCKEELCFGPDRKVRN